MLLWQFFKIIIYVKIVGKIPDQHLNVWLFSNPGDMVHIHVESTGQICPYPCQVLVTGVYTAKEQLCLYLLVKTCQAE